jgi:hypothetical protein
MIPFVALQMIPVTFGEMLSRTLSGGFAPPTAWQNGAVVFMVYSATRRRYCFMCYKRYCLRAKINRGMMDACHAQGVAEPEYEEKGGFVTIVFKRPLVSGEIHNDSNALSNGKELARSWQGVGKDLGLDYMVLEIIGELSRREVDY